MDSSYPNANLKNYKVVAFSEIAHPNDIVNDISTSIIPNTKIKSLNNINFHVNEYQLNYKHDDNQYEVFVNSRTRTFVFIERLGINTLAKVLKDNGFKVKIQNDAETLEISW